jgi:hypothetical protein
MAKYKYVKYRGKRVKISKGGWDGKNKKGQKRRLIKGKLVIWENYLKKLKKEKEKQEAVKEEQPKEEEIEEKEEEEVDLNEIKKEMLDKFDFWAYNNLKGYQKSRHKIMSNLEIEELSDEGEDVYQLNANGTDPKSQKKFPIKIRYDKRNSTLEVYLRDYKYNEKKTEEDKENIKEGVKYAN